MNRLSLNFREFGNPWTVQALCLIVQEKIPKIMFLIETKSNSMHIEFVSKKLGYFGCFCVNSVGKNGGLALLWKDDLKVEIINYSQWHISACVELEGLPFKWIFMGFYREPKTSKRFLSWNLLKELKPPNNTPWVVIRDFNEILFHHEKWGAKDQSENLMTNFTNTLVQCGLTDLGMRGNQFTWSNKHADNTFTKEKLDRVVANFSWSNLFYDWWAEILTPFCSNHKPLVLSCK